MAFRKSTPAKLSNANATQETGWKVGPVRCVFCGYRQTSVRPAASTAALECGRCHRMGCVEMFEIEPAAESDPSTPDDERADRN